MEKLEGLRPEGLGVSVVSLTELYEGVFYSRNPEAGRRGLEDFLEDIPALDVDEEICQIFGKERGRLRKQGGLIGDFDLLIASTCVSNDLILLTNNVRHFQRVEGLRIISSGK